MRKSCTSWKEDFVTRLAAIYGISALAKPCERLRVLFTVSRIRSKVWLEHGALSYVECVADDVKPGKLTSFPQAVKLKRGEVVIFSWATYKSRADRDKVVAKVMADKRMQMDMKKAPFDGKRMIWGGFKAFIEEKGSRK